MYYGITKGPVSDQARELLNRQGSKTPSAIETFNLAQLKAVSDATLAHVMAMKTAQEKMGMPGSSAAAPNSKTEGSSFAGQAQTDANNIANAAATTSGGNITPSTSENDVKNRVIDEMNNSQGYGPNSTADANNKWSHQATDASMNPNFDQDSLPYAYSDGGSGSSGGGTAEKRGGPVRAGHLYHVAEGNKPEMLVPKKGAPVMLGKEQSIVPQQDGDIIPNDKLHSMVRARLNGQGQSQQAPQEDPKAAAMKLRMMSMLGGRGGR